MLQNAIALLNIYIFSAYNIRVIYERIVFMIIKMSAQFDSVDSAEFAAKDLKYTVSNITSLTIKKINYYKQQQNFSNYLVPNYIQPTTTDVFAGVKIDNSPDNSDADFYAQLNIVCDSVSEPQVRKIVLSHGGLKISKL